MLISRKPVAVKNEPKPVDGSGLSCAMPYKVAGSRTENVDSKTVGEWEKADLSLEWGRWVAVVICLSNQQLGTLS